MSDPRRHQRKRGVPLPPGVVYVGRPTVFGNPFGGEREGSVYQYREWLSSGVLPHIWVPALDGVVNLSARRRAVLRRLRELRGKDLACWCPLDLPCHAAVLLELANREERGSRG